MGKLLTAAEAQNKTSEVLESTAEQELQEIAKSIESACENGEYHTYYTGELPNSIIKELMDNGYTLKAEDGPICSTTFLIKWMP